MGHVPACLHMCFPFTLKLYGQQLNIEHKLHAKLHVGSFITMMQSQQLTDVGPSAGSGPISGQLRTSGFTTTSSSFTPCAATFIIIIQLQAATHVASSTAAGSGMAQAAAWPS
ncbi:hypothetical protein Dimus_005543 [Dionaea muscipula]